MIGTVFIVDGDTALRAVHEQVLFRMGYDTKVFNSAQTFLRQELSTSADSQPSCILLDLDLPDATGLEVQRALSGDHPPVIFTSAAACIPACVQAIRSGALDFLKKPVDQAKLLQAVADAMAVDANLRKHRCSIAAVKRRVATLTTREEEVLRQVLSGRLNKNIGAMLGITEKTVKAHRARVYTKMRLGSLAELSRQCALAGIEPTPLGNKNDCDFPRTQGTIHR